MKLFDRLEKLRDRRRPYCTMIVPAAGESRRMGGGNKLLLPLEGEPVLADTPFAGTFWSLPSGPSTPPRWWTRSYWPPGRSVWRRWRSCARNVACKSPCGW